MYLTRKCASCKEDFRKEEMIQYSSVSGKTTQWFCHNCYEEKLSREKFSNKICEIFGLKTPGPLIWTQRKQLHAKYGYTDEAILDCLDYVYNIEHISKLKDSLGLVNPRNMQHMKAWRAANKAKAGSIAAAIANTEMKEYVAPVRENESKKVEINLDDALLD